MRLSRFAYPTSISLVVAILTIMLVIVVKSQPNNKHLTLLWSDEFSGPAGQPPSSDKWNQDIGGGGWGNGEWEYYTGSPSNASLDGAGHLVITAKRERAPGACAFGPCNITSSRLQTDGTFAATYGHFEARLKLPAGTSFWPAFWMLANDNQGEVDIMENLGQNPKIVTGSLHGPGYSGPNGLTGTFAFPEPHTAADGFHIYSLDWTPSSLAWSVDGQVYYTVKPTDVGRHLWVFNKPFYLLLNLAVGSPDASYPDASTLFPAQMIIDYVRVYKFNP